MAEHDYIIANGTGSAVRTDLNNVLSAIASNNSKATDLTTNYAYQWYADTGDNTLKIRNAANDAYVNVSAVGGIGSVNLGLAALTGATFTGDVILDNQVDLRFEEATANGSNFIAFQAPAAITSDVTLTLPAVAPTANQVLTADASTPTTLTWATPTVQATGATFTGDVVLDNQVDLRFEEATANGSNFIALQAPAAITSDVTLTLPAVAPTAGQVLQADSSTPTTLTWGSAAGVGGATGVDFNDDVAIRFGNSNDVSLDYNSTNDRLEIVTSDGASIEIDSDNDLIAESDDDITLIAGDDLFIKHGTAASNEAMITCNSDGSIQLYCDNTERLRTLSTGVEIFGALAGIGVGTSVAVLREVQPHATDAGTFTSGADRVRVLNTEEHDGEGFCTLDTSTGEFTLTAGTYLIYFEAGAYDVSNHRTKIVTDGGTDKLFGLNVQSHTSYPNATVSTGFGVVTNASSEGYFLKHRGSVTRSTNGLGRNANFASEEEFFATVVIWRIDT